MFAFIQQIMILTFKKKMELITFDAKSEEQQLCFILMQAELMGSKLIDVSFRIKPENVTLLELKGYIVQLFENSTTIKTEKDQGLSSSQNFQSWYKFIRYALKLS